MQHAKKNAENEVMKQLSKECNALDENKLDIIKVYELRDAFAIATESLEDITIENVEKLVEDM